MGQVLHKAKITAETALLKTRIWLRTVIQLLGLALICVGAWNMLVTQVADVEYILTTYRTIVPTATFFADVLLIAAGAITVKIL